MPATVFGTGNEVVQNLLQQLVDLETSEQGSSAGDVGEVTVLDTNTLIRPSNTGRRAIAIQNIGTQIVFIATESVATLNSFPVAPDGTLEIDGYFGDISGIVASGSVLVRYIEVI